MKGIFIYWLIQFFSWEAKKKGTSAKYKSRTGENEKKVTESTESTGLLSDKVFTDGLSSPECAKNLVSCLRILRAV